MESLLLSKSRLNTYCLCPEKFRLSYVENIRPERTPIAMIEGSAIHHIVENCLVYGNAIPKMAELASGEYWQDIQLHETEYASAEDMKSAQDKVLMESQAFLERIGKLETHRMEEYFEHPLVDPLSGEVDENIVLRGYADIIDAPEKDKIRLIDIKTTGKSPHLEQANRSLELTVYAYLMACSFGFHIEVPVSFLYLVRSKEAKVIWLNSLRCLPDFKKLFDTIQNIASAIRQGLFWKNQGLHCAWCPHTEICFGSSLAA